MPLSLFSLINAFYVNNKLETSTEYDIPILDELEKIKNMVAQAAETKNRSALGNALVLYDELTSTNKKSPAALFQKAEALDLLAQLERSNARLEQAISTFQQVLSLPKVPDKLFSLAGNKCVELLKFRGWYDNAIEIQQRLLLRFPNSSSEANKLGTLFLYVNKNSKAKHVFEKLLKEHPMDGYALVHLGFILKLEGSTNTNSIDEKEQKRIKETLEKGADFLRKGISTKDTGVMEGKFYFHLGDALRRLGRTVDADNVYKEAAEAGAILSFWQRSLYNVEGLKGKPVWTLAESGIGNELNMIRQNWKKISEEALEILNRKLYHSEGENLSDTGRWAQYELYRQGRKIERNCKNAPNTCNLIDTIPQISRNRRGQVKFSWMEAGTHVHAHSGPTNCRLRAHLGLKVPENSSVANNELSSKLRVAQEYLTWKNGEIFIFDDSFDHEVWHDNPAKESRVVLILDLWHPELTEHQKISLPAI